MVKAAIKRNFTEREWKSFKTENSLRNLQITGQKKASQFKSDSPDSRSPVTPANKQFNLLGRFLPSKPKEPGETQVKTTRNEGSGSQLAAILS